MKTSFRMASMAFLVIASLAYAAVDGYTIKRTPKTGDAAKYRMSAQIDMNGSPITFTAISEEKVTKVNDDGTYQIEQTQGEVKVNDQPMDNLAIKTTTSMKPGGLITKIEGENVGSADYRFANLSAFIEPDKAVAVGDTWTHEFPADTKTGALKAKVEYKVLGEEKLGDQDTLKIKVSFKELEGDDQATSEGTYWVSTTDWSLYKLAAKWTNVPVPGAPMLVSADITMTRELPKK